jgi:hypothetical protein
MTAVVSAYYKGINVERRKKERFKAVGFEPRQVNKKRGDAAFFILVWNFYIQVGTYAQIS